MVGNIIDAHLHVNLSERYPLDSLIKHMDAACIGKGVLIVNTIDELVAIKDEFSVFDDNRNRLHVVAGLNIHDRDPFGILNYFIGLGCTPDIKIHPRLHGYVLNDADLLCKSIEQSCSEIKNIVVDAAFMGDQIENHIGIQLGMILAKCFSNKNIVIAHAGSTRMLECQMLTRWIPNIAYDLSLSSSYLIGTSIRFDMVNLIRYTSNRIMFGSDYPSISFMSAIQNFKTLCEESEVDQLQIASMFYDNANSLYFCDCVSG